MRVPQQRHHGEDAFAIDREISEVERSAVAPDVEHFNNRLLRRETRWVVAIVFGCYFGVPGRVVGKSGVQAGPRECAEGEDGKDSNLGGFALGNCSGEGVLMVQISVVS